MTANNALAIKSDGQIELRSRNDNDFSVRYPTITEALKKMPDETVIEGEVVAIDASGHSSFNLLQNYSSSKAPLLGLARKSLVRSLRPEPACARYGSR